MYYRITVTGEIANFGANSSGTRRVYVDYKSDRQLLLTFSLAPLFLRKLPPEIEEDDQLVVEEVEEIPSGQRVTETSSPKSPKSPKSTPKPV